MPLIDRLLTIVITATLTSAAWIVIGSGYIDRQRGGQGYGATETTSEPTAASSASPARSGPETQETTPLMIPVAGVDRAELRDSFAEQRGGDRPHRALDIAAPAGTAVLAAAPGTIEKLYVSDAGGNTLYVRSADRLTLYYYAHLQAYARDLEEGRAVRQGQRLGSVGSTGNANPAAPHLHFAVLSTSPEAKWWEPARALNPYKLLTERD